MKAKKGQTKSKKQEEKIDLDNEIVIGLNTNYEHNSEFRKKTSKNLKRKPKKNKKKKTKRKNKERAKRNLKIAKVLFLFILSVTAIALVMLSDLFKCKEILVKGNSHVPSEEIINLSTIKTEENMFKINIRKAKENIESNPYINSVNIKRKLDGKIVIVVEERVATYMLTSEQGCIYINSQGYILEISNEPIQAPTIIGFNTDLQTKKTGERLEKDDLYLLQKILTIMEVAKTKELNQYITYINISDMKDIQIYIDQERKTIHLGDEQNIGKKLERAKVVMEQESQKAGDIYVQDIEKIYFREKV